MKKIVLITVLLVGICAGFDFDFSQLDREYQQGVCLFNILTLAEVLDSLHIDPKHIDQNTVEDVKKTIEGETQKVDNIIDACREVDLKASLFMPTAAPECTEKIDEVIQKSKGIKKGEQENIHSLLQEATGAFHNQDQNVTPVCKQSDLPDFQKLKSIIKGGKI